MVKFCFGFFISLVFLSSLIFTCPVFAQTETASSSSVMNGLDITTVYTIKDSEPQSGDIMTNSGDGIKRSNTPFDTKIFGVYQKNPLIVFRNVDGSGYPIVRNGNTKVNVSDLNGSIKKGDFITSSAIAGKGQKATKSGYVLGMALEDFDPTTNTAQALNKQTVAGKTASVGTIEVAIRIEYAEIDTARSTNRLLELADAALFSTVRNPDLFVRVIRYTGSVVVLIATASFAYLVFARSVGNGIQAIGRNPLARRSIQIAIVLNIIFSSVVILLGIIAAFVLLRA